MDQPADAYDRILETLRNLEKRIARIEAYLEISPPTPHAEDETEEEVAASSRLREQPEDLEVEIGQNWFAKAGIILLALGFAFILTFPYQGLPAAAPGLAGYVLAAGVILLSRVWKHTLPLISRYLLGASLALLYFTTLRLYFFGSTPVLSAGTLFGAALLSAVPILNLVVSLRRQSPYLAGLSLLTGYATAIIVDRAPFVFAALILLTTTMVWLRYRSGWKYLVLMGVFCTYLSHLVWGMNNPFLGHEIRLQLEPATNVLFVLAYAVIFSAAGWKREDRKDEDPLTIALSFLNGAGAYMLFVILTIPMLPGAFVAFHLTASAVFLGLAVAYWERHHSKYSTFVYSMLGYMALSVALVRHFPAPTVFIWLSLQSFLVVTTAVWFRSKYIVAANFFIYLGILVAYVVSAGKGNLASLSMGFVALASARILNWKQERLELKTEMMRNAYLTSAFFVFPYALYYSVPRQYVSLSWIGVAMLYYVLNRVVRRQKYLWMGHLTLGLTVLYILIIGIIQMTPGYRIVSFLVLGIVLLAISIIYTQRRAKASRTSRPSDKTE